MTDDGLYEPYDRLVAIWYLGEEMLVPENNILLRCFQFAAPEEIPYGDFCWNGDCHNCAITVIRGGENLEVLACTTPVAEGDEIIEAGPEVRKALAQIGRQDARPDTDPD